ncbi:MAG: hypothetical protein M3131_03700 [Actinomycetota bacterium]|nr:hypothetical protein [Actinomycetota bacterium]
MSEPGIGVEVKWVANPFRGDAFEEIWLPAAAAAVDYGATGWAFFRAKDGLLDFVQWAFFPAVVDFDRYWYSEEIAAARAKASGLYQVPLLPKYYGIVGQGSVSVPTVGSGQPGG